MSKVKTRYRIVMHRVIDALRRHILLYWVVRALHVLPQLALTQQDKVLDVGCGAGLWTLAIAPGVQCIVGLDLRPHLVQNAKTQSDRQGHRNTAFIVASATALPFRDNSFD
ncbi:MAG: class I SAM-dependent methyltransferase, partial [Chloroflexi bacterium]|nr:class I SAM-dependent methyltransferase [Chloroflexota bacterium]